MALRTPPSWLQNGSHTAENDRLTVQGIFRTSGILAPADLAVTQSGTPAMSVSVASGWAAILGTFQANMGAYQVYNDAATTLTVTTADPTNPRIDLVVVAVQDAFYSGATNTVVFTVVAGTPAGSPVAPSAPANSIVLAQIAVAALATTIVNANITDKRVLAQSSHGTPVIPNMSLGFTTQATAASTLILTANSNAKQEFTGTTASQVVQMPVTSTLSIGWQSTISNKSTQSIAVNSSGGNLIATVPAGTDWLFTCNAITGTTAASWSNSYVGASAVPSSTAPALIKVMSASFSAVADTATTFDGIFTNTYKKYMVVIDGLFGSNVGATSLMQYRVGGATQSANTYYAEAFGYKPANTLVNTGVNPSTSVQMTILGTDINSSSGAVLNFFNVGNSSNRGKFHGTLWDGYQTAAVTIGGNYATNATIDGLIFSATAGTITGTVTVYGLAN